jgi:hypothetical protein
VKTRGGCRWLANKQLGDGTGTKVSRAKVVRGILGVNMKLRLHVLVAVIHALQHGYWEEVLQKIQAGVKMHASHICRSVRLVPVPVLTAGLAGIMSGHMAEVKEHSACFADGHVRFELDWDNQQRKPCRGVLCPHSPCCQAVAWEEGIGAPDT